MAFISFIALLLSGCPGVFPSESGFPQTNESNVNNSTTGASESSFLIQGKENDNNAGLIFFNDTNGDGKIDASSLDTDEDGVPDIFFYDTNGDGKTDYWKSLIISGSAKSMSEAWDLGGDAIPDVYDSNGDGSIDAWDLNSDGRIDQRDTNGDGKADLHDDDFNGIFDELEPK